MRKASGTYLCRRVWVRVRGEPTLPLPAAAVLSETSGLWDLRACLTMPRVAGADGGRLHLRSVWRQPQHPLSHLQRSPDAARGPGEQLQRDAITFRHLSHRPGLSFRDGLACEGSPRASSQPHHPDPPSAALRFSRRLHKSLRRAPLPLSLSKHHPLSLLSASRHFF